MTDVSSAGTSVPRPSTRAEQALTLVGAVWLTAGLFIDGYAHTNIIDTATEDFFTPWHAIFYSGFLATAAWVLYVAFRRPAGAGILNRFPPGYKLAALGLALFAVGGVGDGIWHTIYGIETGVDALLSPTHLLLFSGIFLIVTAPIRAAWADPADRSGWAGLAIPVVSALLVTALVAFFFAYIWGLSENYWIGVQYIPETGQNLGLVMEGVSQSMVSTVILVAPVVYLLRSWQLPFGSVTLMWPVVAALEAVAFDKELIAIPAALAGGLVFDLALRLPIATRRQLVRVSALLAPIAMWSVWMWLNRNDPGIAMPIEIWTGTIFFAGLAGAGLATLVFTQPLPEAGHIQSN